MAFGEKLFKLRKERGLSQEALEEKVNTTCQAISK
ncbi:helix-turn-helix transcriptional regulator [Clostridium sp. NSJ-27]|uniref:Helix-turn-helix transcriptional regulator n=1 Tax=Clostridium facile TaxID=2763035 RepID=A0ABR7IQQ7_9CLOT|nr:MULTISPECIES: helix-turn-helix transcriptional regulator [Clostridiaceae]MBC5787480.1 helix-turn-helix transcriptional regulator [Clostridium facile]